VPVFATLPILTEAELTEFFGADLDGTRRYRLLHAVLIAGMTQREAAEAHQISERTVRNVLRAYTESGLEALRTRRAPGLRSPTPAEQALMSALAAEPQAGGDRLWRLAQDLMGETAEPLSRRTAYRILARLRAEEDAAPGDDEDEAADDDDVDEDELDEEDDLDDEDFEDDELDDSDDDVDEDDEDEE